MNKLDMKPVLRCHNLVKTFTQGPSDVEVLKGLDICIEKGQKLAIVGSSGSGKSTLLHLLGGLDLPTSGSVELLGQSLSAMGDKQRGEIRNRYLGFIYQFHHLLPEFSAIENVAMPLLIGGVERTDALQQATQLLQKIGLNHRLQHQPAELSGGERQRVAIARALVTKPACVLADEPTGNLDSKTADSVFSMMLELNEQHETALVMVTHDQSLAQRMDKVLQLDNGVFAS